MAALCKKAQIILNELALVPAVFQLRLIRICMEKIKNASNFRINGNRNDQR